MSPATHHTVSPLRTLVNWLLALVPANLFLSLLATFYGGTEASGSGLPSEIMHFVLVFAVLMFWSLLLMLPVLGGFMFLGASLNKRALQFEQYFIFHNLLHLLICLLWFTVLDYLLNGLFGDYEIPFLGVVYTVAGLLVWNASFLVSFARTKRSW